jgi:hypothetical protein
MGKNARKGQDANNIVRGPAPEGQESDVVGLEGMEDHIEKLRRVSVSTKNLMNLLGDQLQRLSATVPIIRGFEIVRVQLYRGSCWLFV